MYKNIGKKIKGFSIVLAWAVVACSCFFAFYRLFSNTINTENIIISVAVVLGGCLAAIVVSWFIYAYGAIADAAEKQSENAETLILAIDDLSNNLKNTQQKTKSNSNSENNNEIPLGDFKLPESREELFRSQLRKLKKDYEMSRITYDEYEEGKQRLEEKYR